MEKCVQTLSSEVLCRDSLIRKLYSYLNPKEDAFSSIFVFGHTGTGKSLLIQKLLEYLGFRFSIINCVEHTNGKSMFEKILLDLSGEQLSRENGYKITKKSDNVLDFVNHLRNISKSVGRMVIVFKKPERIRDMDNNTWLAMLKLKEITGNLDVVTIFTSNLVMEKFIPQCGAPYPFLVHFPQYTQDEMQKILMYYRPQNYEDDFYARYLDLFLRTFYRFCRDLNELRYMAKKNFVEFVKPIEKGLTTKHDWSALWKNVQGYFKKNLEVLYLKLSNDDFARQDPLSIEIESTKKLATSYELPYYAKYLLIASFLASYNPTKEDKRLFVKEGPRAKKSRRKAIVKPKNSGPGSFLLNRMLAIFACIIEEKVDISATLMSQIQTMCQLGLLDLVGDANNIDEPKYRCCVGKEFIEALSKNVEFELKHYLYDRMHD